MPSNGPFVTTISLLVVCFLIPDICTLQWNIIELLKHVFFTFCRHKNTRIQLWKKTTYTWHRLYMTWVWRFVQNVKLKNRPVNRTSRNTRWIKVIIVLPFVNIFRGDRIMSPLVSWNRYINLAQNVWSCISQNVVFFWPLEWICSWCSSILHAGHTCIITTYLYNYENIC